MNATMLHSELLVASYCRALTEKINKKNKHANVKPFMVKNHLWLFLSCNIENPAFDSQVCSLLMRLIE